MTPNTLVRITRGPYAGMTGLTGGVGRMQTEVILTATGQPVDVPHGDLRLVDPRPISARAARWRLRTERALNDAARTTIGTHAVSPPAHRERSVSPARRATQPGEANAATIGRLRERLAAGRVTP